MTLVALVCLGTLAAAADAHSAECPCLNDTSYFEFARTAEGSTFALSFASAGRSGELANGQLLHYPLDYGLARCHVWDDALPPFCNGAPPRPAFCATPWCFIDPARCRATKTPIWKAHLLQPLPLYYSYETCVQNGSLQSLLQARVAEEQWVSYTVLTPLVGVTLTVGFAALWWPSHFKRDELGAEVSYGHPRYEEIYTNDSIPWEGVSVEFFGALLDEANRLGLNVSAVHTYVSGAARHRHANPWTAAVDDVGTGLLDVSPGELWPTPDRLKLAPFTLPYKESEFWLFVPRPDDESASVSAFSHLSRCFLPFTEGLWGAIIAATLCVGLLHAYLAMRVEPNSGGGSEVNGGKERSWSRRLRSSLRTRSGGCGDGGGASEQLWTCTAQAAGELLSGGVGLDVEQIVSAGGRLLYLGWGFFVLLVISSYTANLAAFLTQEGQQNGYPSTIEELRRKGDAICLNEVMMPLATARYPGVHFVGSISEETIVNEGCRGGQCGAVLLDGADIEEAPETTGKLVCDAGLGVPPGQKLGVLHSEYAIPVRQEYVAAFSYLIRSLAERGVNVQNFELQYKARKNCTYAIVASPSSNAQPAITLEEMSAAFVVLFVCCVLAVACSELRLAREKKAVAKPVEAVVRSSECAVAPSTSITW
ncbi:hypothetical protein AB1Y20_020153 [Prymnesium parvum]|uniref:Ionotropic glutamate receptor C-terminal domain-containing protein n=1 Tax=Prymnesium parvum TaxID=97485 RepID=A0AB34JTV4_PRYPA